MTGNQQGGKRGAKKKTIKTEGRLGNFFFTTELAVPSRCQQSISVFTESISTANKSIVLFHSYSEFGVFMFQLPNQTQPHCILVSLASLHRLGAHVQQRFLSALPGADRQGCVFLLLHVRTSSTGLKTHCGGPDPMLSGRAQSTTLPMRGCWESN